jgi:hypothetical protein
MIYRDVAETKKLKSKQTNNTHAAHGGGIGITRPILLSFPLLFPSSTRAKGILFRSPCTSPLANPINRPMRVTWQAICFILFIFIFNYFKTHTRARHARHAHRAG